MNENTSRGLRELIRKLAAESKQHPGGFAYQDSESQIEDGDYGEVSEDDRPEFVRQDDDGWIRLQQR